MMKELTVTLPISELRELYATASEDMKSELEKRFPESRLSNKIEDRVKTYEDACNEIGIDHLLLPGVTDLPASLSAKIIAFYKLMVITEALNEGWVPDFSNPIQPKYWVYAYFDSHSAACGLAYSSSYSAWTFSISLIGARLCFKDKATAEYALETFKPLYIELSTYQQPE